MTRKPKPPVPETILIEDPLIVVYRQGEEVTTTIHHDPDDDYELYAMIAADLIKHIANAFEVDNDDVMDMVKSEFYRPTGKPTFFS